MEQAHLSPAAYQRLKDELDHLQGPAKRELADKIEVARELGDLKENADYHAAKDQQGLNEARIRQLEAMLKTAVVVDEVSVDEVGPGRYVTISIAGDDPEEFLFGSIEEKHDNVLTSASALGQAVAGKRVGEVARYETPAGKTLEVEVRAIRAAD
jgi:transcription elongation factor GreA